MSMMRQGWAEPLFSEKTTHGTRTPRYTSLDQLTSRGAALVVGGIHFPLPYIPAMPCYRSKQLEVKLQWPPFSYPKIPPKSTGRAAKQPEMTHQHLGETPMRAPVSRPVPPNHHHLPRSTLTCGACAGRRRAPHPPGCSHRSGRTGRDGWRRRRRDDRPRTASR